MKTLETLKKLLAIENYYKTKFDYVLKFNNYVLGIYDYNNEVSIFCEYDASYELIDEYNNYKFKQLWGHGDLDNIIMDKYDYKFLNNHKDFKVKDMINFFNLEELNDDEQLYYEIA